MLWRLIRKQPLSLAVAPFLNQSSFLLVVALSLATILVTGSHLGRHFGLVKGNPLVASARPHDPGRGLDPATKREVGLVPAPAASPIAPKPPGPVLGSTVSEILVGADLPSVRDLQRPLRGGTWLPILMYHYVRDVPRSDRVGWALSVSPSDFRKQVAWLLENGFTPITMRDADLILVGQMKAPERPVALTFDDGYRDFYTTAAPILRSAGFTATNYIPTQLVGGSNYMSWSEIEDLDAEGFEMAAHSQFHTDVSKAGLDRARTEIFGSKADLESHLGHAVVDWAFPYGGFSRPTIELLREAGFWSATTTQPGSWHDARHLLYLTRVRMGGTAGLGSLAAGLTAPSSPAPAAPN